MPQQQLCQDSDIAVKVGGTKDQKGGVDGVVFWCWAGRDQATGLRRGEKARNTLFLVGVALPRVSQGSSLWERPQSLHGLQTLVSMDLKCNEDLS